jgi:hypothetical protein
MIRCSRKGHGPVSAITNALFPQSRRPSSQDGHNLPRFNPHLSTFHSRSTNCQMQASLCKEYSAECEHIMAVSQDDKTHNESTQMYYRGLRFSHEYCLRGMLHCCWLVNSYHCLTGSPWLHLQGQLVTEAGPSINYVLAGTLLHPRKFETLTVNSFMWRICTFQSHFSCTQEWFNLTWKCKTSYMVSQPVGWMDWWMDGWIDGWMVVK